MSSAFDRTPTCSRTCSSTASRHLPCTCSPPLALSPHTHPNPNPNPNPQPQPQPQHQPQPQPQPYCVYCIQDAEGKGVGPADPEIQQLGILVLALFCGAVPPAAIQPHLPPMLPCVYLLCNHMHPACNPMCPGARALHRAAPARAQADHGLHVRGDETLYGALLPLPGGYPDPSTLTP